MADDQQPDASRFVTQTELEEARKARQLEWERVRRPDDPEKPPDEETPYDSRTLHERLREQRDKAQTELQEAHRLKHMVRGLEEDESKFLEHVDTLKLAQHRQRRMEELALLKEVKEHSRQPVDLVDVARAQLATKPQAKIPARSKQANLLGVAIKRKCPPEESASAVHQEPSSTSPPGNESGPPSKESRGPGALRAIGMRPSAVQVAGVLPAARPLPGVCTYGSSDSSSSSSDSESGSNRDLGSAPSAGVSAQPQQQAERRVSVEQKGAGVAQQRHGCSK